MLLCFTFYIVLINFLFASGIVGTLLFNKPYYEGTYENRELEMDEINVNGYEDGLSFVIKGGMNLFSHFLIFPAYFVRIMYYIFCFQNTVNILKQFMLMVRLILI